jgi:hypothetical protein
MSDTTVVNLRGMDTFDRRFYKVTRIDRRTIFGNPFKIGKDGNRDQVCDQYEEWFQQMVRDDPDFKKRVLQLKGATLGCWCKPARCHGDTIVAWLKEQE